MFDLGPAAQELSRLVQGVGDAQLGDPTPCSDWTVADLLAHIHQFSSVFTTTARKEPMDPPQVLVDQWRTAIPAQLDELAQAWTEPSAWEGQVSAGGIEMAAADNAVVGIEELTTHGWDLAVATGQGFEVSETDLDLVDRFFTLFADDEHPEQGPFGPTAPVAADASHLERTVARTGRDPRWAPPPPAVPFTT